MSTQGLVQIHVAYSSDSDKWIVKKAGTQTIYGSYETKKDAVDAGRQIAKSLKGELVVHRKDGTIESRDSYGNDPYPSRG